MEQKSIMDDLLWADDQLVPVSALAPSLFIVDIGRTLGRFTGPSVTEVLTDLSPWGHLNPAGIRTVVQSILHVEPELTEDVIRRVCDALLIDRKSWPDPWPESGFDPFPDAPRALAALAEIAPIAALSNLSVTGGDRLADVERHLGGYLNWIYTSFALGGRKPERWLWHHIATRHDTTADRLVHSGDRWIEDILGAAYAGARAIWVPHETASSAPVAPPQVAHRITTAPDLRALAELAHTGQLTGVSP